MSSWQRVVAKAMVSVAFAATALWKTKAIVTEPFAQDHVVMSFVTGWEFVLAGLFWTRFSNAACWAGAAFVAIGSFAYPVFAPHVPAGCGCLGATYLSPIQHAGLGLVLFVLCGVLLMDKQGTTGGKRPRAA